MNRESLTNSSSNFTQRYVNKKAPTTSRIVNELWPQLSTTTWKINDTIKSIIEGWSLENSTKKLTNHSARKTVVKKMKTLRLERSSIVKVTGHRNEKSQTATTNLMRSSSDSCPWRHKFWSQQSQSSDTGDISLNHAGKGSNNANPFSAFRSSVRGGSVYTAVALLISIFRRFFRPFSSRRFHHVSSRWSWSFMEIYKGDMSTFCRASANAAIVRSTCVLSRK